MLRAPRSGGKPTYIIIYQKLYKFDKTRNSKDHFQICCIKKRVSLVPYKMYEKSTPRLLGIRIT